MKNTIVISAGGTGGHVFPAVCLAEELEKRKFNVIFATDKRGLKYLGKYEKTAIIHNINTSSRIKLYISLVINVFKSFFKLFKLKPKIVIGFGGYPSVPFVLATQLMFKKTIIHEQNAVIGKANDLLSIYADKIITSFPFTKALLLNKEFICIGNPTRFENLYDKAKQPENDVFTILIFGGSQGAKVFSEEIVEAICELSKTIEIKVFHQGRKDDIDKIKGSYQKYEIDSIVQDFFTNIGDLYQKADLVISRSGASSIFEIIGFAKPAILIPYENSINGDQEENANFLESHDAAVVMNESKLKKETLVGTLVYLANNIERRAEISNNLKNLRKKDPAKKFADIVEETI